MDKIERYYSISTFLKNFFGKKTVKLSIDAGFTCPNRDGTCGYGGCSFCSSGGSGELASEYTPGKIADAINEQIEIMSDKWPDAVYLAYFQAHSNTYAAVDELRSKYYEALSDPRISGIVIATRPDCLDEDVLDLLEEINSKYFMWIELGLQSIHPETREAMNIGYPLETYTHAVDELISRNIRIVSHLILGLPGETEEQMLDSVRFVCQKPIFGLKLHLMNLVSNSALYRTMPDYVSFDSIEEYVDLVVRCLEIIPPDITIHRLTGDVPRNLLVSPEWSYRKRTILNSINKELREKDSFQGKKA
ncbi:MAG: TIGR01212 family radical SAM protein [Clostridiales bacterium]|nr:TIGR01212 family radical SAM protein [Candidatus Crickella caballi]